jgi:hypothetical protein
MDNFSIEFRLFCATRYAKYAQPGNSKWLCQTEYPQKDNNQSVVNQSLNQSYVKNPGYANHSHKNPGLKNHSHQNPGLLLTSYNLSTMTPNYTTFQVDLKAIKESRWKKGMWGRSAEEFQQDFENLRPEHQVDLDSKGIRE